MLLTTMLHLCSSAATRICSATGSIIQRPSMHPLVSGTTTVFRSVNRWPEGLPRRGNTTAPSPFDLRSPISSGPQVTSVALGTGPPGITASFTASPLRCLPQDCDRLLCIVSNLDRLQRSQLGLQRVVGARVMPPEAVTNSLLSHRRAGSASTQASSNFAVPATLPGIAASSTFCNRGDRDIGNVQRFVSDILYDPRHVVVDIGITIIQHCEKQYREQRANSESTNTTMTRPTFLLWHLIRNSAVLATPTEKSDTLPPPIVDVGAAESRADERLAAPPPLVLPDSTRRKDDDHRAEEEGGPRSEQHSNLIPRMVVASIVVHWPPPDMFSQCRRHYSRDGQYDEGPYGDLFSCQPSEHQRDAAHEHSEASANCRRH